MVRMNRRMYGFFRKRLDEAGLDGRKRTAELVLFRFCPPGPLAR